MTVSNSATDNFRIKIIPIRVVLFNQSNLPSSFPFLQSLLPLDRILGIVELLEIDQPRDVVFLCEAFDQLRLVLRDAPDQIVGDTDVQRAADAASENVDVEAACAHLRPLEYW